MNKTILIHTIGNRDLQFFKEEATFKDKERLLLTDNREDERFMVLKNDWEGDRLFRANSDELLRYLEADSAGRLKKNLQFPMLEMAIQHVVDQKTPVDQIRICVTKQADPHHQDTDYVGKICSQYYFPKLQEKFYIPEIKIEEMDVKPDPNKVTVMQTVNKILERVLAEGFNHVYISNRQGLPDVTFAFVICGLFQSFHYLSITPRGVVKADISEYEDLIVNLMNRKLYKRD